LKREIVLLLILGLGSLFFTQAKDPPKGFPPLPPGEDVQLIQSKVDIGRELFFDPILSIDSSVACASCHLPEYAFSGGPMKSNVGISEVPLIRNTPALFNLAWYEAMGWTTQSSTIEEHISIPLTHPDEMASNWDYIVKSLRENDTYPSLFEDAYGDAVIDSARVVEVLGQFLRNLISANSRYDRAVRGELHLTEKELAGLELVNDQVKTGCLHCHVTDAHLLGTNGLSAINGLLPSDLDPGRYSQTSDSIDYGRFKTPSLRNLKYTAPYMHDGRFATLEEVIDFYDKDVHSLPGLDSKLQFAVGGLGLSPKEKEQIIAFLNALNDESFVSNNQ